MEQTVFSVTSSLVYRWVDLYLSGKETLERTFVPKFADNITSYEYSVIFGDTSWSSKEVWVRSHDFLIATAQDNSDQIKSDKSNTSQPHNVAW